MINNIPYKSLLFFVINYNTDILILIIRQNIISLKMSLLMNWGSFGGLFRDDPRL